MTTYVLPEELRPILSRPLGELASGDDIDVAELVRTHIRSHRVSKVVFVGDTVSRRASEGGLLPDVIIIDRLEKRLHAPIFKYAQRKVIYAKNAPGLIEDNARIAVEKAIQGQADLVEVEGEEDLLTIIAIMASPIDSLVVYGQPDEGVVLVRVSEDSKKNAVRMLDQMKRIDAS